LFFGQNKGDKFPLTGVNINSTLKENVSSWYKQADWTDQRLQGSHQMAVGCHDYMTSVCEVFLFHQQTLAAAAD